MHGLNHRANRWLVPRSPSRGRRHEVLPPSRCLPARTISYTITVENTGNAPLVGVTVNDTLLGDIADEFDFDFADPFPIGETVTANVTYTPQAGDPDPITNTVTASGSGEDSETEATDVASCTTDITHEPGIDVTKSCPESAQVGDTITYAITITNTGDENLEDITVMDSLVGDLSAPSPTPSRRAIQSRTTSTTSSVSRARNRSRTP